MTATAMQRDPVSKTNINNMEYQGPGKREAMQEKKILESRKRMIGGDQGPGGRKIENMPTDSSKSQEDLETRGTRNSN